MRLDSALHWESDRPKSCSELVDGRDQSKFLRYVTPGEYGTRKEGVFISVNSGVDYSIYSSSSGSSIGWYKYNTQVWVHSWREEEEEEEIGSGSVRSLSHLSVFVIEHLCRQHETNKIK
jgi:hypothetical protein